MKSCFSCVRILWTALLLMVLTGPWALAAGPT